MATKFYQIKSGDTLTKIARNFKVPINYIMQRNSIIKDKNKIQAGWVLRIPDFTEMKAMSTKLTSRKPPSLPPIPNTRVFTKEPVSKVSTLFNQRVAKLTKPKSVVEARLLENIPASKPRVDTRPDYRDGGVTATSKPYQPIPAIETSKLSGSDPILYEPDKIYNTKNLSTEEIMEASRATPNLVWEQQPNWFQKTYNKVALATKKLITGQPAIERALRQEALGIYPLGEAGQDLIKAIDVNVLKDNPLELLLYGQTVTNVFGVHGDWTPVEMPPDLLNRIPQYIRDSLKFQQNTRGSIRIMTPRSETLMHEVLHSNFETSLINRFGLVGLKTFEQSWAKARDEMPWETFIVDQTIQSLYNKDDTLSFKSLQHERYAWFGALFGKSGLQKLPKALKPYYGGIFK